MDAWLTAEVGIGRESGVDGWRKSAMADGAGESFQIAVGLGDAKNCFLQLWKWQMSLPFPWRQIFALLLQKQFSVSGNSQSIRFGTVSDQDLFLVAEQLFCCPAFPSRRIQ